MSKSSAFNAPKWCIVWENLLASLLVDSEELGFDIKFTTPFVMKKNTLHYRRGNIFIYVSSCNANLAEENDKFNQVFFDSYTIAFYLFIVVVFCHHSMNNPSKTTTTSLIKSSIYLIIQHSSVFNVSWPCNWFVYNMLYCIPSILVVCVK